MSGAVCVDLAEIRCALTLLLEPGAVAELRVLHAGRDGTVSGYYDDVDALAQEAARWSGRAPGIYVTLNPVLPALLARAQNRARARAEQTTSDRDVLLRRWLPIDFDPARPAGISSTEAEHAAALVAAQAVRAELRQARWPDPLFADSGNGGHLLYRIDCPNDAASTALLQRCLAALAWRYDDEAVTVDLKTANAARIWKVYGTLAAKGDSTADRPHRVARLLEVPTRVEVVSTEQLARLAALAPESPRVDPQRNGHGVSFDLERWLARHEDKLRVVGPAPWLGGDRWILNPCPWNSEHTNRAAYLVRFPNGAIASGCHHAGCAGRDWASLRDLVEPGWRDRTVSTASSARDSGGGGWHRAQPAPDFLAGDEAEPPFLEARLLAPGSITEFFSPRGLGKTHVAHALMVKHAQQGRPILLIDRDNSRREVRRRLRGWGAAHAPNLRVLTRDHAPALTDRPAWESFPFDTYELVVIDSIDAATEGVGEQDSAKPAAALAPILDIARREAGPAILVLGNVVKSGAYGRGSGIVEDRADVVYEVRDATEFQPTGTKAWWLELPAAGREAWGDRAVRRRRRDRYRLAFIPSKFRIGEEPDPFVLEIDLSDEPWQLRDVTAHLEAAGQAAVAAAVADREARRTVAAAALEARIREQADAGAAWTIGQAETCLVREYELRQREARQLLRDGTGRRWLVITDGSRRGHPRLLFPVTALARGGEFGVTTRDVDEKERDSEVSSPVTRLDSWQRETRSEIPASDAAIPGGLVSRQPPNTPLVRVADENADAPQLLGASSGPTRDAPPTWGEV